MKGFLLASNQRYIRHSYGIFHFIQSQNTRRNGHFGEERNHRVDGESQEKQFVESFRRQFESLFAQFIAARFEIYRIVVDYIVRAVRRDRLDDT